MVILQKATSRDAASIIQLLDTRLIEKLHALLQTATDNDPLQGKNFEDNKENSGRVNVSNNQFLQ